MAEEIKNANKELSAEEKREKLKETLDESRHTIEHGKLELMTPIRSGGKDITVIEYDFSKLDSFDVMDALDSDAKNRDSVNLSNRQAFALFAAAVDKVHQGLDATDIKNRMGADDSFTAVRVAKAFFNVSAQRGALSISEA